MHDIVIIGGGAIGCSIARELSKYNVDIVVVEKDNDVCSGTSSANSAIVHSGYDPLPCSEKARLNVLGNSMFPKLCADLDVHLEMIGSLTVATNQEEMETLKSLAQRAKENNVPTEIIGQEKLQELEPNLNKSLLGALLAPTCGIVNPFEYTVALMENAMDNGAQLKLNWEVANIEFKDNKYIITNVDGDVLEAKVVINAAGVYSDKISSLVEKDIFSVKARKGQYFVLDSFAKGFVNHTIFMCPSEKGKGVLISPTTSGNYIIGPSSEWTDDKEDVSTSKDVLDFVKDQAKRIMENVPYQYMVRQYSGLRAVASTGDFLIKPLDNHKTFINVAGIQSPGLASSPAIALDVLSYVKEVLPLEEKANFNPKRRPVIRMKNMSLEEKQAYVKEYPEFGHMICRCEKISEGEIVDCIRRNAGATTVKGVKKRCRPGFGKCQGTFCETQVVNILARELARKKDTICYDAKDSIILKYETKVGDSNGK